MLQYFMTANHTPNTTLDFYSCARASLPEETK